MSNDHADRSPAVPTLCAWIELPTTQFESIDTVVVVLTVGCPTRILVFRGRSLQLASLSLYLQ